MQRAVFAVFAVGACVVLWGISGCAVLPPSRTDLGSVVSPGGSVNTSFRASAGTHYASATKSHSVGWDVGIGGVYERSADQLTTADAPDGVPAEERMGGYVEVARAVETSHSRRTWVGVRAETLAMISSLKGADVAPESALMLRWSTEFYGTGSGAFAEGNGSGFVAAGYRGTAGVGVFAEAGVRGTFGETPSFVATTGLSIRLPFLAFAGFACR